MQETNKRKTAYNFKNTCQKCYNDIEFPLLGDFSYGEVIFQTKDGQEFYIAELINNKTYHFISEYLNTDQELKSKRTDPQRILIIVADKSTDKEFATEYPICPNCKSVQIYYTDNVRTSKSELHYATWNHFEQLKDNDKIEEIRKAAIG